MRMPQNEVLDRADAQGQFRVELASAMEAVASSLLFREIATCEVSTRELEAVAFVNQEFGELLSEPVKALPLLNPIRHATTNALMVQLVWYWRFKWDQHVSHLRVQDTE